MASTKSEIQDFVLIWWSNQTKLDKKEQKKKYYA